MDISLASSALLFLLILVKVKILISVIMVPLDFADVRGMYAFYDWTAFMTGQLFLDRL